MGTLSIIKIFCLLKGFLIRYYLLFIIFILFYFSANYTKSPFIKDEKRKFKPAKNEFEYQKTLANVREQQTIYPVRDLHVDQLYSKEVLYERDIRIKRHEVLDFPIVWQPDIVDEGDDWRYRRSPYLGRPVLRVSSFGTFEASYMTDWDKAVVYTQVFMVLIGGPTIFVWIIINWLEILHFIIQITIFNDYLIKKIGLQKDSLYTVILRLYYSNYINKAVEELVAYGINLEREVESKRLDFVRTSYMDKIELKKGVHNYMIVNKIVMEMNFAYERSELNDFICKEILSDFTTIRKLQIAEEEKLHVQSRDFVSDLYDSSVWLYKKLALRIRVPFTSLGLNFSFSNSTLRTHSTNRSMFYYKKDDFLSMWAYDNALIYGDCLLIGQFWKYDKCDIYEYDIGDYPTIIERIRNVPYKPVTLTDCLVYVKNKIIAAIKPNKKSYFWPVFDFFNFFDKNHRFNSFLCRCFNFSNSSHPLNDVYCLTVLPVKEAYADVKESLSTTRQNLYDSFIGPYWFLYHPEPGAWIEKKSPHYTVTHYEWKPSNTINLFKLKAPLVQARTEYIYNRGALHWYIGFTTLPFGTHKDTFLFGNYDFNKDGEITIHPADEAFGNPKLFSNVFVSREKFFDDEFYQKKFEEYALGKSKGKSSLDIFWLDYDLGINLFSNLISLNLFIDFLAIIFLFMVFSFNVRSIRTYNSYIAKKIYFFFWDLFKNLVLNVRLERFFFVIVSYFFCIIFFNLGGFSFYELSFMSHISITFFFSFSIFINYIINLLINFNELFYLKFVQKANIILVPFLFIIEIISFFVRPFSLGIRLFANVMSGHILMHMFFSTFLFCYKLSFWLSLFIFSFCLFIFFMELFVSFIQAYIFMILLLVYSIDLVNIH